MLSSYTYLKLFKKKKNNTEILSNKINLDKVFIQKKKKNNLDKVSEIT